MTPAVLADVVTFARAKVAAGNAGDLDVAVVALADERDAAVKLAEGARYAIALADRLAAVEARLPVVAHERCDAWSTGVHCEREAGHPVRPGSLHSAHLPDGREMRWASYYPAPPPSAEPTTPTYEQLVERAGPVSSGQLAGSAEATTLAAPVDPVGLDAVAVDWQPTGGASVPDGYVLGEGWSVSVFYRNHEGPCDNHACRRRPALSYEDAGRIARLCAACAVKRGCLVPIDPPNTETAQVTETSHSEDCDVRAGRSRNCSCGGRDVSAEPTAPSIVCGAFFEPIAEPAAPPVAAKLSERINALPDWARRHIHDLETNCDPAGTVRDLVLLRDREAALETALAAAKAENEALRAQLAGSK